MKRICLIYYLTDSTPLNREQADHVGIMYDCNKTIMIKACNQLNGIQYPYITVDEIEGDEEQLQPDANLNDKP